MLELAPLAADIVVATAFFCCVALQGGRGLARCLLPLAATFIAGAGAIILTAALREKVTELLYPWLREQLLARMDLSGIRSRLLADVAAQLQRLLPEAVARYAAHLDLDVESFVADAIEAAPFSAGARIAEDAFSAMLHPITAELVRGGLLVALFLVLRLLLGALTAVVGFVPELPLLRWMDRLLGAVLGAVECAVVLWLLLRAVRLLNYAPALELLEQTRLASKFM